MRYLEPSAIATCTRHEPRELTPHATALQVATVDVPHRLALLLCVGRDARWRVAFAHRSTTGSSPAFFRELFHALEPFELRRPCIALFPSPTDIALALAESIELVAAPAPIVSDLVAMFETLRTMLDDASARSDRRRRERPRNAHARDSRRRAVNRRSARLRSTRRARGERDGDKVFAAHHRGVVRLREELAHEQRLQFWRQST